MTPSENTYRRTPYELWYNRKSSVEYLKAFGCAAYAHANAINRDKLDARAKLCMYLVDDTTEPLLPPAPRTALTELLHTTTGDDTGSGTDHTPQVEPSDKTTPNPLPSLSDALERGTNTYSFVSETPYTPPNRPSKRPRYEDEIKLTEFTSKEDIEEATERLHTVLSLLAIRYVPEPKTYKAAMASSYAREWRAAAKSEYQSLMDNKTWILVPPPKGRRVLQNRWVFVVKYTGTGDIDRFKARLVIKGFLQQYGIDYDEIFSPVIRTEVLRLLLIIATYLDFEIHQMDVKTAFLNGVLTEEIYMAQPEGFAAPGQEHLSGVPEAD
ncbi:unnamed protein product [Phytophthora fragariaefolia]|uniref:Unnamed protein product n=1 Tax=Phytophthora fragariaefolia TaxID=1490495 RepID=A0A9W6XBH3_9STRA|nr:unnamed protein product [Phytophthora fragariaefolia]